jgi:putative two-component system response regulator
MTTNTIPIAAGQDQMVSRLEATIKLLDSVAEPLPPRRSGTVPPTVPCEAESARIMVVDDETVNIKVIQKYLKQAGYSRICGISDPALVLAGITLEQPDVILLDVMMPRISGLDLLSTIRSNPETAHLPVLILTALCDRETRLAVLERGATDFLAKPVDPYELVPRVRNALTVKKYHDGLRNYTQSLEDAVRLRTAELETSRREVVYCLARAAELRDDNTGHHVLRVGKYAAAIGRALGMEEPDVEMLEQAAQLHDIGKIGIPDEILLKPGALDPEQYKRMQQHVDMGQKIIDPPSQVDWKTLTHCVEFGQQVLESGRSPLLKMAARIALTHHERWNGKGYPRGLAGEDIPLEGRITAVADVFDALSSRRPYKPPYPLNQCFAIIAAERGEHFDPAIVDIFLAQRDAIAEIQIRFADVL